MELAPFQPIKLHSVPRAAVALLQVIGLAAPGPLFLREQSSSGCHESFRKVPVAEFDTTIRLFITACHEASSGYTQNKEPRRPSQRGEENRRLQNSYRSAGAATNRPIPPELDGRRNRYSLARRQPNRTQAPCL